MKRQAARTQEKIPDSAHGGAPFATDSGWLESFESQRQVERNGARQAGPRMLESVSLPSPTPVVLGAIFTLALAGCGAGGSSGSGGTVLLSEALWPTQPLDRS